MAISDGDQHDDHCRLSFLGEDWWIMSMRGPLILLTNENGPKVLDVSHVDWKVYQETAVSWLKHRAAGIQIEGEGK